MPEAQIEADIRTIAASAEEAEYLRSRLDCANPLRRGLRVWRIRRAGRLIRQGIIRPGVDACERGNWP